ncbi:DUF1634 domain-containing protein [Tunturiibacter gelidoferens]|uniref:DUF1634 domain-containing protein n=1 Tax=Tunturiibacter gelidiferens TaxID=3069689 RepID=A0AAU7YUS6_9BACT
MDLAIGKLLRFGAIFSAVLVSLGGVLYLQHPLRSAPKYNHFLAESTSLQGVAGVLRGAVHLDANSVIQLGLLFLIATPVARVAFCIVGFARQKDHLYIVISSSVLVILIYSLIQGGR